MFAFIDESGYPHPNDTTQNPVLAAVCFSQEQIRSVIKKMYRLKNEIYGEGNNMELKAKMVLRPRIVETNSKHKEFVDRIINEVLCGTPDTKVFAVVMNKPEKKIDGLNNIARLPNYYRLLLQRINNYAQISNTKCVIALDTKDEGKDIIISKQLKNYIFKSKEGNNYSSILETAFFVNSKVEECIQLADLCAGIIRHKYETSYSQTPQNNFSNWINTLYNYLQALTQNLPNRCYPNIDIENEENPILYGIYKINSNDLIC